MKNIFLIFLSFLFIGCGASNKSIEYTQTVFIINDSVTLQDSDFKQIEYKKIADDTYSGYYILSQKGNEKLKKLFDGQIGKSFGIIVNNHVLKFNTQIVENIYETQTLPITFQFPEEKLKLFLHSIGREFKE